MGCKKCGCDLYTSSSAYCSRCEQGYQTVMVNIPQCNKCDAKDQRIAELECRISWLESDAPARRIAELESRVQQLEAEQARLRDCLYEVSHDWWDNYRIVKEIAEIYDFDDDDMLVSFIKEERERSKAERVSDDVLKGISDSLKAMIDKFEPRSSEWVYCLMSLERLAPILDLRRKNKEKEASDEASD